MVRQNAKTLVGHLSTSSKALDRILALEAEVSRLRHHVSVLSKRLHKLEPPRSKISRADTTPSPAIEEVNLRSAGGGKAVEKEGVAEEKPPKGKGKGVDEVAVVVADDVAEVTFEAGAMAVEFRGKRRRLEDDVAMIDEDVVVGGKIVPLGALEPDKVEVVGVGSSTVVPKAPKAILEWGGGEMVCRAPAGPGGRGGTGVGMGPSRGRGYGYGLRSGGSAPSGVAYMGNTGGFYARGRGRGFGRGWNG